MGVVLTKKYKLEDWFEDLRTLFKEAGMENKNIVFLFNDTQIFDESILEQIVSIL